MPADVLSIVSLTMASLQVGGPIVAEKCFKGAAQKKYTDAAQQYSQLKRLRKDVDQYFTEDERESLDSSIEQIAFDLMALEQALQGFKNIAYWRVNTYAKELRSFNRDVESFLAEVVVVHKEITRRSTQGRERTRLGGIAPNALNGPVVAPANDNAQLPRSQAQSTLNAILTGQTELDLTPANSTDDQETYREVMGAVTQAAVSALRLSRESGSSQEGAGDSQLGAPSPRVPYTLSRSDVVLRRSATAPGTGPRWHVQPKSTSAPASLAPASVPDIELNTFSEDID